MYVIIVDGYSTGSLFVGSLRAIGIKTIHVKSFPVLSSFLNNTHHSNYYDFDLDCFDGNHEKLIQKIKNITKTTAIKTILIGTTAYNGFLLADHLSKSLRILGNSPETTMNRIDKYLMNNILETKSIASLRQYLTTDFDDLRQWVEKIGYPIVLKPLLSGGGEKVFVCHDEKQLQKNFEINAKIERNMYSSKNPIESRGKVLAQEFLPGMEYVICSFSHSGKHTITSIWKSKKRFINEGSMRARDYLELINPKNSNEFHPLANYIKKVLTCLNLENGPCNSDVIMDERRGPLLLEINPRVPGGMDPIIFWKCQDESLIDQTVQWSINPSKIVKNDDYPFKSYGFCVSLVTSRDGYIQEFPLIEIEKLSSFLKLSVKYKVGDYVKKTTDISELAGMIYLSTDSKKQILEDIAFIREWEKEYLGCRLKNSLVSQSIFSNGSLGSNQNSAQELDQRPSLISRL